MHTCQCEQALHILAYHRRCLECHQCGKMVLPQYIYSVYDFRSYTLYTLLRFLKREILYALNHASTQLWDQASYKIVCSLSFKHWLVHSWGKIELITVNGFICFYLIQIFLSHSLLLGVWRILIIWGIMFHLWVTLRIYSFDDWVMVKQSMWVARHTDNPSDIMCMDSAWLQLFIDHQWLRVQLIQCCYCCSFPYHISCSSLVSLPWMETNSISIKVTRSCLL